MNRRRPLLLALVGLALAGPHQLPSGSSWIQPAAAQDGKAEPAAAAAAPNGETAPVAEAAVPNAIEVFELLPDLHMMTTGIGANIVVGHGEDGAFLIDTPMTEDGYAKLGELEEPIRFVILTHFHGDHVAQVERLAKEEGAIAIAHENVRTRMSETQYNDTFAQEVPPSPESARPVVTFPESMTFYFNGHKIVAQHIAPAHTDGDVYVHIEEDNVLICGDLFFNGMYPLVDTPAGGTLDGSILAIDELLGLCDDETQIVPGHGPLATKADLLRYRNMLIDARNRISRMIQDGKTRDQVIGANPLADLDAEWGGGFLPAAVFVQVAYDDLAGK